MARMLLLEPDRLQEGIASEQSAIWQRGGGRGAGGEGPRRRRTGRKAAARTAAVCFSLLLFGLGLVLVGGSGGSPLLRSDACCARRLPGVRLHARASECPCSEGDRGIGDDEDDRRRLLVARLRGGAAARTGSSLMQEVEDGDGSYELGNSEGEEYRDSDLSSSGGEEVEGRYNRGYGGGKEEEKGERQRVPTEQEKEDAKRELEQIMSDPEVYRRFKNHTIDAFHDECADKGMTMARLIEHFDTFLELWYPDLELDGTPGLEYFREFGMEYFGDVVPFDQKLMDEWEAHWKETSNGRKMEEATFGDADAFSAKKFAETQQLRSKVTVPNDCDGLQQAVDMCADGGEVSVKRHIEEGRIVMSTDPVLFLGSDQGRRMTIRGDGGGIPQSAVDFWGRVQLDCVSPGAIEDIRILRDGPQPAVVNDSDISTMIVMGEWSMAGCQVRASILTAVSAGGRANLTMERCEVGGIGEASGTEYSERLKTLRLEDEDVDGKVANAIGAAKKARKWHEVNKHDAVMEQRLRDVETNPEAVSREGDSMWDHAIKLMREAGAVTDARVQEDPMDVNEGALAMAAVQGDFAQQDKLYGVGATSPEVTASTTTTTAATAKSARASLTPAEAVAAVGQSSRRAEALQTAGWVEVSSRCGDAICVIGRASVRLTACTISLAALYAGALLRCGGRAGISATGVMLRDAGFSVSVHGDGSVSLDHCESRFVSRHIPPMPITPVNTSRFARSISQPASQPASQPS
jgi:hypothetical protein